MTEKLDYVVKADGWVAGKWRKAGSPIEMTATQAKYETNLVLASEAEAEVQLVGSLDDPLVKSTGLAEKTKSEKTKRNRTRK